MSASEAQAQSPENVNILVFSDDATVRAQVMNAVGVRAGKGLPKISWTEVATADGVMMEVLGETEYALAIVDGEAPKFSGIGLTKMIHDEVPDDNPNLDLPVIAILGRPQDEWLARYAGVAAHVAHPVDAKELSNAVATILSRKA